MLCTHGTEAFSVANFSGGCVSFRFTLGFINASLSSPDSNRPPEAAAISSSPEPPNPQCSAKFPLMEAAVFRCRTSASRAHQSPSKGRLAAAPISGGIVAIQRLSHAWPLGPHGRHRIREYWTFKSTDSQKRRLLEAWNHPIFSTNQLRVFEF